MPWNSLECCYNWLFFIPLSRVLVKYRNIFFSIIRKCCSHRFVWSKSGPCRRELDPTVEEPKGTNCRVFKGAAVEKLGNLCQFRNEVDISHSWEAPRGILDMELEENFVYYQWAPLFSYIRKENNESWSHFASE